MAPLKKTDGRRAGTLRSPQLSATWLSHELGSSFAYNCLAQGVSDGLMNPSADGTSATIAKCLLAIKAKILRVFVSSESAGSSSSDFRCSDRIAPIGSSWLNSWADTKTRRAVFHWLTNPEKSQLIGLGMLMIRFERFRVPGRAAGIRNFKFDANIFIPARRSLDIGDF